MKIFFVSVPFNGKIREAKRKLKRASVKTVSFGSLKKYNNKQEKIIPASSPKTKWSIFNLPSSVSNFSFTILIEVDYRKAI
ncbi:MAG: hypothetical protein QXR76_01885 [Candidatus Bathyarchaeia archaeon]